MDGPGQRLTKLRKFLLRQESKKLEIQKLKAEEKLISKLSHLALIIGTIILIAIFIFKKVY